MFRKVNNIQFEYSSDNDFPVKVYILKLVVEHHKQLRHLKSIEFDYIKTPEEMQAICSINRELIDLKFHILIGVRIMSTIIKSESFDSLLRKAHKITKLFLTIEDS